MLAEERDAMVERRWFRWDLRAEARRRRAMALADAIVVELPAPRDTGPDEAGDDGDDPMWDGLRGATW